MRHIVQESSKQYIIMEQEVKLVVAQSLEGENEEYLIFKNVNLGEGGYGVVKKAVAASRKTQELAVKIVPYGGDPKTREKIEREINIIRLLPPHPNLVRVLPLKCFSENNFYIFMELCGDGTLTKWVQQPGQLPQEQLFDAFWQLMSGYRVLWEHKIAHQDLKLANVLIKNGVLKITDFGFSILSEKYIPSLTREGTLQYMSLQKLTSAAFVADELADIYSLGVMMHELMTKMHPYLNQKGLNNPRVYAPALKSASLFRPKLVTSFSARLQGLYDLVTRMVAKDPKHRANCSEIYTYLDNDQAFASLRGKEREKSMEVTVQLPAMTIIEKTSVFAIPFAVSPEEESSYIKKVKNEQEVRRNQENQKVIAKIQRWALSLRLLVYYFDRLARRLFVEKLRGQFGAEKAHSYNRTILSCLLTESKLTRLILKQLRFPQQFSKEEAAIFRGSQEYQRTLQVVRRDEEYIREEITDNLKRTTQVQIKEQVALMQLGEREEFKEFVDKVTPYFQDTLRRKSGLISTRKDLVTIIYLIDSLNLLAPLPDAPKELELQEYFYATETRSKEMLLNEVQAYFGTSGIDANYDEDIYSEEEALVIN